LATVDESATELAPARSELVSQMSLGDQATGRALAAGNRLATRCYVYTAMSHGLDVSPSVRFGDITIARDE
jgi:hypothetical protein